MEVVVVSRQMFADPEYLPLFDGDMIISIMSPGDTHPRPKAKGPRLDIQFWDVTEEIMDGEKLWRPIDDYHGMMIVTFVEEHIHFTNRIVIHCEAGVSRSAGVAVGLSRYFDLGMTENELRDRFPHFNLTVAQKIWKACEERNYVPVAPSYNGIMSDSESEDGCSIQPGASN